MRPKRPARFASLHPGHGAPAPRPAEPTRPASLMGRAGATLALACLPLTGTAQDAAPQVPLARTLPALSDVVPQLSLLALPVDSVCGMRTDDPFELRDCAKEMETLRAAAARLLPSQRFHATGTLRARPFDFDRGVYVVALEDINGDVVPPLLRDADLYLGGFRPDQRANMLPTVHSGSLSCKVATIPGLRGVDTPYGRVGDRYATIVLDPWTITSPRLTEDAARESPLRDAELSVDLVVRVEQEDVNLCCDIGIRALLHDAWPACRYRPWRVVVEEARAEGLPTLGFATPVEPTDGTGLLPLPE